MNRGGWVVGRHRSLPWVKLPSGSRAMRQGCHGPNHVALKRSLRNRRCRHGVGDRLDGAGRDRQRPVDCARTRSTGAREKTPAISRVRACAPGETVESAWRPHRPLSSLSTRRAPARERSASAQGSEDRHRATLPASSSLNGGQYWGD